MPRDQSDSEIVRAARRRRAELAGVVEHRLAGGQFQQHRAAVAHAEERAIEPIAMVRPGGAANPTAIHPANSAAHQRRGGRSRGNAASRPKPP